MDNNITEYKMKIIKSNRRTMSATIKDGIVVVRAPLRIADKEIMRFLQEHESWILKNLAKYQEMEKQMGEPLKLEEIKELAEKALKEIPPIVKYYAEIIGVSYGRITVRNQTTKWGSCTAKGNLNFNCLLMLAPREVLESVIVHELCHRKYMDHSKRFYDEILKVFPDYHKWDKWLKDNGGILINRMRRGLS
ncbi:MAG: M48 family metallopeptidase [Lachnospiraceae bacterium]|nr:M48 family metallopeptidase [Lachnospiraceae bacterium]